MPSLLFSSNILLAAFIFLPLFVLPRVQSGQPPGGVRFNDVTNQAGITFRHISTPEKRYIVESMSGGVALMDFDNDGQRTSTSSTL